QKQAATTMSTLPPLSRWSGPAAVQLVRWAVRKPGLSDVVYRQRVHRLNLQQEQPILVRKIRGRDGDFTVRYTSAGWQWVQDRLTSAVTRNGQKMSRDSLTPAPFNAAN